MVYTWPEVAGVGYTEEQLKEAGIPYKPGKFPFRALGRARASMDIEGMVKVLAHKETDEILGVHIVGARAADMIAEGGGPNGIPRLGGRCGADEPRAPDLYGGF